MGVNEDETSLEVQSEKVDITFLEVVPGVAALLDGVVPDD